MSKQKKLTAKDLSEKFGFTVSENDLTPDVNKDSKYVNMPAELSQLEAFAAEHTARPKKTEEKKAQPAVPETEPSFAELFEARNQHVSEKVPPDTPAPAIEKKSGKVYSNKLISYSDNDDFGALLRSSRAPIVDKDKVQVSDEKFKPLEVTEDDLTKVAGKTFNGFDALANAFGRGGKGRK